MCEPWGKRPGFDLRRLYPLPCPWPAFSLGLLVLLTGLASADDDGVGPGGVLLGRPVPATGGASVQLNVGKLIKEARSRYRDTAEVVVHGAPSRRERQHERTLSYLENRIFGAAQPELAVQSRLEALETAVFGAPLTTADSNFSGRLENLTYHMPLLSRGIRVKNEAGQTVAQVTAVQPVDQKPDRAPENPSHQPLEAIALRPHTHAATAPSAISPPAITLYVPAVLWVANPALGEALTFWRRHLPWQLVSSPAEAQVRLYPLPQASNSPQVRMATEATTGRLLIGISYPTDGITPRQWAHALGHAVFGVQRHSASPADLMYAAAGLDTDEAAVTRLPASVSASLPESAALSPAEQEALRQRFSR